SAFERTSTRSCARTRPAATRPSICAASAEKNTSAGAPALICRARSFDPPRVQTTLWPLAFSKPPGTSRTTSVRLDAAKRLSSSAEAEATSGRSASAVRTRWRTAIEDIGGDHSIRLAASRPRLVLEDRLQLPPETGEELAERAARHLLEVPAVDRTEAAGHLVPGLEVLHGRGALLDGPEVRQPAELDLLEAVGDLELAGRAEPRGAAHEVGPDRQRDAGSVAFPADGRRLVEADPHSGDHRRAEAHEP